VELESPSAKSDYRLMHAKLAQMLELRKVDKHGACLWIGLDARFFDQASERSSIGDTTSTMSMPQLPRPNLLPLGTDELNSTFDLTAEFDEIASVAHQTHDGTLGLRINEGVKGAPAIMDRVVPVSPVTILVLSSRPRDAPDPGIDEEIREIDSALKRSRQRHDFDLRSLGAVEARELASLIMDHQPRVLHFGGHGNSAGELQFVGRDHTSVGSDMNAIAGVFEVLADVVRCVVLNACYTATQASLIARHVDVVVGMSYVVDRDHAREFSAGFYEALGYGRSVADAFKLAKERFALCGGDSSAPMLCVRDGVDASRLFLHEANAGGTVADKREPERAGANQLLWVGATDKFGRTTQDFLLRRPGHFFESREKNLEKYTDPLSFAIVNSLIGCTSFFGIAHLLGYILDWEYVTDTNFPDGFNVSKLSIYIGTSITFSFFSLLLSALMLKAAAKLFRGTVTLKQVMISAAYSTSSIWLNMAYLGMAAFVVLTVGIAIPGSANPVGRALYITYQALALTVLFPYFIAGVAALSQISFWRLLLGYILVPVLFVLALIVVLIIIFAGALAAAWLMAMQ
jgi:hypothetical protein